MSREIQAHLKENQLPKDTKLFVILGHYDDLRVEMLSRGWVEHVNPHPGSKNPSEKFKSQAFHFMYTTKAKDNFRIANMAPSIQHINHFEGTKALTTKVGLTHNMKNLIWKHTIDIDAFFPESFDLSDLAGDEVKDFYEEFKFCQTIAYLRQIMELPSKTVLVGKCTDKIMVALSICEKRLALNSPEFFVNKEL